MRKLFSNSYLNTLPKHRNIILFTLGLPHFKTSFTLRNDEIIHLRTKNTYSPRSSPWLAVWCLLDMNPCRIDVAVTRSRPRIRATTAFPTPRIDVPTTLSCPRICVTVSARLTVWAPMYKSNDFLRWERNLVGLVECQACSDTLSDFVSS
jgi:hypothetical protein